MKVLWRDVENHLIQEKATQNEINSIKLLFNTNAFIDLALIEFGLVLERKKNSFDSQKALAITTVITNDLSGHDLYDLIDFVHNHELTFKQAASITPQQVLGLDEDTKEIIQKALISGQDEDEDHIRYSLSQIVQTGFPYREVKGDQFFERKNGDLTVTMSAPNPIGLPSGILPRLFFVYICSEIVKNQSKEIRLGESLKKFVVDKLGRTWSTGKKTGANHRWPKVIASVLATTFTITHKFTNNNIHNINLKNISISDNFNLWYEDGYDENLGAIIEISDPFYDAVTKHATPLDIRALKELSSLTSPLSFDLYCWMTYRYWKMEQFKTPVVRIAWKQLHGQLGTSIENVRQFKIECRNALKKVKAVYPEANFNDESDSYLILTTSIPHIKPKRIQKTDAA